MEIVIHPCSFVYETKERMPELSDEAVMTACTCLVNIMGFSCSYALKLILHHRLWMYSTMACWSVTLSYIQQINNTKKKMLVLQLVKSLSGLCSDVPSYCIC